MLARAFRLTLDAGEDEPGRDRADRVGGGHQREAPGAPPSVSRTNVGYADDPRPGRDRDGDAENDDRGGEHRQRPQCGEALADAGAAECAACPPR